MEADQTAADEKIEAKRKNRIMPTQDGNESYGKSIVYSPAARKSVDSVIRLNKQEDSYKNERSVISGMVSAPPFGGSHPVTMWED